MGLLRWLRGGDDADSSVGGMSAGLAEIEAIFVPSKRKQTELVEEQFNARIDVASGQPLDEIDLDGNVAVIHRRSPVEVVIDVPDDGVGDELDGDRGKQQTGDAG
ncbi:hypothetical protein STSO111631_14395 [Stackebrandtia soli]